MNSYKSDFPIFTNYRAKTGKDLVYLDSAATSQKPKVVINRVMQFYSQENSNVHRGFYDLSEQATLAYEQSRQKIADYLHTEARNIVFTAGSTQSSNMIADSFSNLIEKETDLIISGVAEHHSNFLPWQKIANQKHCQLLLTGLDQDYQLDYSQLQHWLELHKSNVKVVSLTGLSNVTGAITDLQRVVKIVRANSPEALIVIDAAQLLSHKQIDLSTLDIDFLYASGHKLFAETGIGFFWGKTDRLTKMTPALLGGGMIETVTEKTLTLADIPTRFEAGTPNIAGALSLGTAIDYLAALDWTDLEKRSESLRELMLTGLSTIPGLILRGPKKNSERSNLFSFEISGIHPHDIADYLASQQIAVRAGHHCNYILHHDYWKTNGTIRASLHIYNDEEDIDKLITTLRTCQQLFQKK